MDLGIKGKIALVTGAGRGLGRAVALQLAREGVRVIAVSRSLNPLVSLVEEMGGTQAGHLLLQLDLAQPHAASEIQRFVKEQGYSPSILVHNAGGSLGVTDPLASSAEWMKVWNFNLGVTVDINRAVIPEMQRQGWGRIVHISSVSAENYSGYPAYVAAKGALNAYVKSMARVYASQGIIISAMAPGPIDMEGRYFSLLRQENPAKLEEFFDHHLAIRRLGQPAELASAVLFLCSEHGSYAAGTIFGVDGGSH